MAQELLTIPEHMSSPPIFYEIRVARSSVFCVVFCGSLFFLLSLVVRLSVLVLSLVVRLSVLVLSLVVRLSVLVGFYTILSKTKKDHQKQMYSCMVSGSVPRPHVLPLILIRNKIKRKVACYYDLTLCPQTKQCLNYRMAIYNPNLFPIEYL